MRFKADENLPIEVAGQFRKAGHDTFTVPEQKLVGEIDSRLVDRCNREERVLVTLDLDFSDIRTYPPEGSPGLIVLRLRRHGKRHVLGVVDRLLPRLDREPLASHLWIVDEASVRIRAQVDETEQE